MAKLNQQERASISSYQDDRGYQQSEISPLTQHRRKSMAKHLSVAEEEDGTQHLMTGKRVGLQAIGLVLLLLIFLDDSARKNRNATTDIDDSSRIINVEDAQEYLLDLDDTRKIWFRTWGRTNGIPIVFVHGGPGNAIADYLGNGNTRFFADEDDSYFVVEVDQRGTGKSQPSVRDGWQNMRYYQNITITQIVEDFELVRKHLGIERWLVWGGSFGSTLSIHYGERYPQSCLALVLRGLYLDTAEEVHAVYAQETYRNNPKRLHEFNILYEYAARHVSNQEEPLDPNDAERLMRIYAKLITSGDEHAVWHWFVFENNLMELDPQNILDPSNISSPETYREALSVSFFETRLWLHGSFDEPASDLMNPQKIDNLTMPVWVCQGQRDEVCPPQYGQRFVDAVVATQRSPSVVSRFLNATHEDTDPVIEACLQRSLGEFLETYTTRR